MQHILVLEPYFTVISLCKHVVGCQVNSLAVSFPLPDKTVRVRPELKTLLDTTRSRNIEIFLPSFPLSLPSLDKDLNEHLNCINEGSPLMLEHIVALKRCVRKYSTSMTLSVFYVKTAEVKILYSYGTYLEICHYTDTSKHHISIKCP